MILEKDRDVNATKCVVMKKINVLHIELSSDVGGIETFIFNLYSQIDRSKIHFDFITQCAHPAFEKELVELGGNIHVIGSITKLCKYIRNLRTVLNSNYDVIHIHKNSAANIIPLFLMHGMKDKVIIHSHNTAPTVGGISVLLHRINKKYLWKKSRLHLACSRIAGEWLYGDKDFTEISNGIVTNKFRFSKDIYVGKRKEFGISDEEIVIGHVGRFTEQKNHMRLLNIFKIIYRKNNKYKLVLCGDGPLRAEVESKIIQWDLKNVFLLGVRNDVPEIMQMLDVFLMPSLYEGLPFAAIEAQAAGTELFLSSRIARETEITDGVHWFNLEDNNETIAQKIMSVGKTDNCEKRNLRCDQVGEAGYDISITAKKMQNMYESFAER